MTDLLSIGSSSVRNSQLALSVVSNNIANVNTDGYVRQNLAVEEGLPTKSGLFFLGTGALADGVRRSYDGQIEASLRSSLSDLEAQQPLIEQTQRLINVFGNKNASLTPALGSFFDSMRSLSVDASSEILRNQVLNEGQTLASRFNTLAVQLDDIDLETQLQSEQQAKNFNALSEQLAIVNGNLQRVSDINKQPSNLLDTRDQVLRDMSAIMRVSVREASNGAVTVSIGSNNGKTQVVEGLKATPIGVNFIGGTPSRSEIVLNPFVDPINLSGLVGGELGGLINFRDQMLAPAMADLDDLAKVFIDEVNAIHARGMDMNERPGVAMFVSEPEFVTDFRMAQGSASPSVQILESGVENLRPISLVYRAADSAWLAEDQQSGLRYFSSGSPPQIGMNGLLIQINGQAQDGDVLSIEGSNRPARSISMALSTAQELAAGDLFRIAKSVSNTGTADANIRILDVPVRPGGIANLSSVLVNNDNPSAALTVATSYSLAKLTVPAGTQNLGMTLGKSSASTAELQVLTRDGRHLFGSALTDAQRAVMLTEQNGFITDGSYSDTYLNGDSAYLDKAWTMGAHATSVGLVGDDGATTIAAEARLMAAPLPAYTNTTGATVTVVEDGALKLNGTSLGPLTLSGQTLTTSDVVSWLNGEIAKSAIPFTASAINEVRIPASEISATDGTLTINSQVIGSGTPFASTSEIANAINVHSSTTDVAARLDFDGSLILATTAGNEAETISLGSSSSLFTNISGDLQAQVVLQADRASGDTSEKTVALTLSSTGSATDLARLGFNTELKIDGEVSEDLIVFTTGGVGDTAELSASYTAGNANPLALRSSRLQVVFSSSDQYQIQDVATGTVLADRSYVENQSIDYQQLRIDINGEPQAGNLFTIDNNQDGFGSNENLLRLVALESQKVLGEDDTLHESYLNLLNRAGSTARQAQVTQEALQVVYNQAYEARDQVVGVNLDEEAADLIRFQQAYQASAKLIQTANQLFDSILRL